MFDIAIANLITKLYEYENLVDNNIQHYVLFIAESVFEYNQIILERLAKLVDMNIINNKIRFVDYSHYREVLISSQCILDTFPYGGKLFDNYMIILIRYYQYIYI